jgi:hypothetical protein
MGNREVPRIGILRPRAHLGRALTETSLGEEGGSWGKHGFPHATEPEAEETE